LVQLPNPSRPPVSEQIAAAAGRFRVLTPGIVGGFVVLVILLIGTFTVSLANLRSISSTGDAVTRTYSVIVALDRLLLAAVDAETGERGFIITGDATYLDPYERARRAISLDISQVRELVADDPEQRGDLDLLSAATEVKLQELAEAIQLRQKAGFPAAQTLVMTNVGKRTMDGMREIVRRMDAREDARLSTRTVEASQRYGSAVVMGIMTTAVAILAVLGLFVGTRRYGTDRMEAERTAKAQETELREALQLKDEFVTLVSHELRTPANTIAGWARMLEQGAMSPDKSAKAMTTINRNAESLQQLLDDLLDTSQLVAGRMRLAIDVVDLGSVVREAIDAVRLSADNKGVILSSKVQTGAPLMTRGDGVRLKQVVWNLLANGIKFTPRGGEVIVAVTSLGHGVRLEVRDTGEGIDPRFLPYVFDRFRQAAAPARPQRGLGLGLAIARHLVELHGGTISAHSDGPGQGASFVIELPSLPESETVTGSTWTEIGHA